MAANRIRNAVLVVTGLCLAGAWAEAAAPNANLKKGKPDLKSAAKLAFGPDGRTVRDVAWVYPKVKPGHELIEGRFGFYAGSRGATNEES